MSETPPTLYCANHPTVETTLAQAVLVLALIITFTISRWQGQRNPATRPVASRS